MRLRERPERLESLESLSETWENVTGMAEGVLPSLRELAAEWVGPKERR